MQEREAAVTRTLLATFLTSHAVLWLSLARGPLLLPSTTELLRHLRLLQQLKVALLPALPALLGVAPRQAGPAVPGLCIPQLLVLSQAPGRPAAADEVAAADRQLCVLLERCRVLLPEDNARALCSLPPDGPLVLCLQERLGGGGSQEQLIAEALSDLAPITPGQVQQQQVQQLATPAAAVAAVLAPRRALVAGGSVQAWRAALCALADTLERAAHRAAASADPDASATAAADAVAPEAAAAVSWQEACSDGVRQFSAAACKRAAAVAAEAYRRNTPQLLPAAGHAVALQAALRLYTSLARGPAAEGGASALRQQLDDFWRGGHQQCEAVSLLGEGGGWGGVGPCESD